MTMSWGVVFSWTLLTGLAVVWAIVWAVAHGLAARVKPPMSELELAEERSAVNRILTAWRDRNRIEAARKPISADFILAWWYPPLAAGPFLKYVARRVLF